MSIRSFNKKFFILSLITRLLVAFLPVVQKNLILNLNLKKLNLHKMYFLHYDVSKHGDFIITHRSKKRISDKNDILLSVGTSKKRSVSALATIFKHYWKGTSYYNFCTTYNGLWNYKMDHWFSWKTGQTDFSIILTKYIKKKCFWLRSNKLCVSFIFFKKERHFYNQNGKRSLVINPILNYLDYSCN